MVYIDYHKKLIKLNLYSLERQRERYMHDNRYGICKATNKRNKRKYTQSKNSTTRKKQNIQIRNTSLECIKRIFECPAKNMERLFNVLQSEMKYHTRASTGAFKMKLGKWLKNFQMSPESTTIQCGWQQRTILLSNNQYTR